MVQPKLDQLALAGRRPGAVLCKHRRPLLTCVCSSLDDNLVTTMMIGRLNCKDNIDKRFTLVTMHGIRTRRQWSFAVALLILLKTAESTDWTDPDTPINKRTTTSLIDGTTYHLVSLPISLFIESFSRLLVHLNSWNSPPRRHLSCFSDSLLLVACPSLYFFRSFQMSSMYQSAASKMVTILYGLPWTSPMTIPARQEEDHCSFTTPLPLRPRTAFSRSRAISKRRPGRAMIM